MIEHIGTIIARVGAEVAVRQARRLAHDVGCGYWAGLNPPDCNCSARPVVDLLLTIARRKAA